MGIEKSFSIDKQLNSMGNINSVNLLPTSNPCQNSYLEACSAHLISLLLIALSAWALKLLQRLGCVTRLKSTLLLSPQIVFVV